MPRSQLAFVNDVADLFEHADGAAHASLRQVQGGDPGQGTGRSITNVRTSRLGADQKRLGQGWLVLPLQDRGQVVGGVSVPVRLERAGQTVSDIMRQPVRSGRRRRRDGAAARA